jgi:hypothetical protein
VKRERQQAGLLLSEGLLDRAGIIAGPGALLSHLVTPEQGLMVEVNQCGKGASRKERGAHKLDGSFDAAFLIAAGWAAGTKGEVVVGRQFEQAGVKVDLVPAAFQNHGLEIVTQQGPGNSVPGLEGMDMAQAEALQRLVEERLHPEGSAVGEGQDKTGQAALGPADLDFPERGPIHLSLFGGKGMQA